MQLKHVQYAEYGGTAISIRTNLHCNTLLREDSWVVASYVASPGALGGGGRGVLEEGVGVVAEVAVGA